MLIISDSGLNEEENIHAKGKITNTNDIKKKKYVITSGFFLNFSPSYKVKIKLPHIFLNINRQELS